MTFLELHTIIDAKIDKVFDLARDIDFHKESAAHTEEEAISGKTSGRIGLGEHVTWRGRHFGVFLTHSSWISRLKKPRYFVDEMRKGHFKFFKHYHLFKLEDGRTVMTDILMYKTPFGILGDLFNYFFLKKHLKKFLIHRNLRLKTMLEN